MNSPYHPVFVNILLAFSCASLDLSTVFADEKAPSGPPTEQESTGKATQQPIALPADDPAVKLTMRLQTASVGFYWRDEQGPIARNRYGDPLFDYSLLAGPDEDGRYRFSRPPGQVCGVLIRGGTDRDGQLTPDDIAGIPEYFPGIEILHITNNGRIASLWAERPEAFAALKELVVNLPVMRGSHTEDDPYVWTVVERKRVSNALFRAVTQLSALEKFDISFCDLHDDDIAQLATLGRLRELGLLVPNRRYEDGTSHIPPVHDFRAETLVDSLAGLKQLRSLDTTGCPWRGQIDWATLAALPHLETLRIGWSEIDDDALEGIENLAHLKTLDLSWTPITGRSLDRLARLANLEMLDLGSTNVLGNILALAELPKLKEVNYPTESFRDYPLDAVELDFFFRSSRWRNIVAVGNPDAFSLLRINELAPGEISTIRIRSHSGRPGLTVTCAKENPDSQTTYREFRLWYRLKERDFDEMGKLDALTFLSVEGGSGQFVTDKQIARFAANEGLKYLTLELDRPITEATLSTLVDLTSLERLSLAGVQLNQAAMDHIAVLPCLETLDIKEGKLAAGALRPLARAKQLKSLTLRSLEIDGPPGARLREIQAIPALESLTIGPRNGNDAECRWIGRSKSLKELRFEGTFSAEGVARLTPMESLEKLLLEGNISIPDADQQLRVLGRNPQLVWAAINNSEYRSGHTQNIYSEAVSREFEIGFAGACSCGCMDVYAPEATIVPEDRFTIRDDRLVLDREFCQSLGQSGTEERYNVKLRIEAPIRRRYLRIDREELPQRLDAIYLNACRVDRLELIDCFDAEIGVFGTSDVSEMHFLESKDHHKRSVKETTPARPSPTLYLAGVRALTIHSSPSLGGLSLEGCGKLRSLWLVGEFPNIERLFFRSAPELRYLGAPYSGHAPKLHLSPPTTVFPALSRLPSLRLLKMPGTAMGTIRQQEPPPSTAGPLPPLHEVDLRSTDVGDQWLEWLTDVKTLRILRIGGCEKLTEQALARFRKARPGVAVVDKE